MSAPDGARPGETWKEYTERMAAFYEPWSGLTLSPKHKKKAKRAASKKDRAAAGGAVDKVPPGRQP